MNPLKFLAATYGAASFSFVGLSAVQNTATGSTLNITPHASTQSGDLMIAVVAQGPNASASPWTMGSGFTEIIDDANDARLGVAVKTAGTEGSPYTFTTGDATKKCSGVILTYRLATYDKVGAATTSGAGAMPAISGVVPVAGSIRLLAIIAHEDANDTFTAPAGMTILWQDNDATHEPSIAVAEEDVTGGSGTGTRTFSDTLTTGQSTGVLLSLLKA
jgi:hypothetical protein